MSLLNSRAGVPRTALFDSAIDRLLDDAMRAAGDRRAAWEPSCNVYEDEHGMTVQLSVPGVDPNKIEVQVKENTLMVKGQRAEEQSDGRRWLTRGIPYGEFSCGFRLPTTVDEQQSSASYRNGILSITFPKREEAKPRRISISCE